MTVIEHAELKELLRKGHDYFPAVNPALFEQVEEWNLYIAMILCKEEQDKCIENEDFLGALRAAAKLTSQ